MNTDPAEEQRQQDSCLSEYGLPPSRFESLCWCRTMVGWVRLSMLEDLFPLLICWTGCLLLKGSTYQCLLCWRCTLGVKAMHIQCPLCVCPMCSKHFGLMFMTHGDPAHLILRINGHCHVAAKQAANPACGTYQTHCCLPHVCVMLRCPRFQKGVSVWRCDKKNLWAFTLLGCHWY